MLQSKRNHKSNDCRETVTQRLSGARIVTRSVLRGGSRSIRTRNSLHRLGRGRRWRVYTTKKINRKKHFIDLVNSQLTVSVNSVGDDGVDDAGGQIDLRARSGDIQRKLAGIAVPGLGSKWVTNGLKLGHGDEIRENMELNQLNFLLIGEGIESARFEIGKGIVRGSQDSEALALVGVVELIVDLVALLCAFEELNEGRELAGLFEDSGDVGRTGGGW